MLLADHLHFPNKSWNTYQCSVQISAGQDFTAIYNSEAKVVTRYLEPGSFLLRFTLDNDLNHNNVTQDIMATVTPPLGPYKLVSVNTAPERAHRMIARLCNEVKDKYTIIHEGNAASTVLSL